MLSELFGAKEKEKTNVEDDGCRVEGWLVSTRTRLDEQPWERKVRRVCREADARHATDLSPLPADNQHLLLIQRTRSH